MNFMPSQRSAFDLGLLNQDFGRRTEPGLLGLSPSQTVREVDVIIYFLFSAQNRTSGIHPKELAHQSFNLQAPPPPNLRSHLPCFLLREMRRTDVIKEMVCRKINNTTNSVVVDKLDRMHTNSPNLSQKPSWWLSKATI